MLRERGIRVSSTWSRCRCRRVFVRAGRLFGRGRERVDALSDAGFQQYAGRDTQRDTQRDAERDT
jgi:hypothetical protein